MQRLLVYNEAGGSQMFADDIVLYNDVDSNFTVYQLDIDRIVNWCICNDLTMNIDKTKYQLFPIGRHVDVDLLANRHKSLIDKEPLQHVNLYKYLGVEIDNLLTMKQHAKNVIKVGAHKLYMMRHIRKVLTTHVALLVSKSVFLGVLDYGSIFVSSTPEEMKDDIQILQNNALRCCLNILDPRKANRITNTLLFSERLIINLLLCIRNAVNQKTLKIKTCDRHTRGNDRLTIVLPVLRTRYMRKTPFYWGLQIWNSLPLHIRLIEDKIHF